MSNQKKNKFKISSSPFLSCKSIKFGKASRQGKTPSVHSGRKVINLTSGRMALALIAEELNISRGEKVLIPNYHCPAMILPFLEKEIDVVFYKVNSDLSPDVDDIRSKIDCLVKAVVVTHYFGFPSNAKLLEEFLHSGNIKLVEDCAHAFFGKYEGMPLGSFGDYAIFSHWKFLPVIDGGGLLIKNHESVVRTYNGKLRYQIKLSLNTVERSVMYGNSIFVKYFFSIPFSIKDCLWGFIKNRRRLPEEKTQQKSSSVKSGVSFDKNMIRIKMSFMSQLISHFLDLDRVICKRRMYFNKMLVAFSTVSGCYPLYNTLPDDVVPYVFPLYIEKYEPVFGMIHQFGIPIFRWEDIPEGICDVSSLYKNHLIQLPLHQELTDVQVDWIIDTVISIINDAESL